MASAYLWLKALHIMAFAAWMAGMWYLPRLLVYHAEATPQGEAARTLAVMERRLLRGITVPAAVLTWLLGLALAATTGAFRQGWFHAKLLLVVGLTALLVWLARERARIAAGGSPRPARTYRIINEIPTLLFAAIVLLVVFRP